MPIRKILVPTDFSAAADIALDQALELGQVFGAQLTLFHTYELPLPTDGSGYLTRETLALIEKSAQAALDAMKIDALRRWRGPPSAIDALLGMGPAALRIVEEAARGGYDLIVMGTHGRTGLKHMFIGSVAERVVRTAACPVMTIRGTLGAFAGHEDGAGSGEKTAPQGAAGARSA